MGAAIWVGFALAAGMLFRSQIELLIARLDHIGSVAGVVVGAALAPRWIPGAIHVPLDAVERHIGHLPKDREIVLYCTCPSEASAARVARILVGHGFERVRPLFGGLDAWVQAGYAVDTGEQGSNMGDDVTGAGR